LIKTLAKNLANRDIKGMSWRSLFDYRLFYQTYPRILQPVVAKLKEFEILVPVEREFQNNELIKYFPIGQPVAAQSN
jgi:hypothetical protein